MSARLKDWRWWCSSCGTLTNDGDCDCTKFDETRNKQRLRPATATGEDEVDAEIQHTIAFERERCAKITEGWHPMLYAPEQGGSHPRDAAYRYAKIAIAAAIRRAPAPQPPTEGGGDER